MSVNASTLESRIIFIIQELEKTLLPQSVRLSLTAELKDLLAKRTLMEETLAKPNDYMGIPDCMDDSSNTDD